MASASTDRTIEIRRATLQHATAIARLNADVQAVHAALIPALFKPAEVDALQAEGVLTWLGRPETIALVASNAEQPVGYAYAEVRRRAANAYAYAFDEIYLHHLSVSPAHRRRGVGAALLEAVGAAGVDLGIERLALDVWTANADAEAFFRAQGFAPYNVRLARGGWATGVAPIPPK